MKTRVKIDFVSDVSCPWCVIGLGALEQALHEVGGDIDAELHFQPFELNPQMPPEGQNIVEHLGQKYGSTPAQVAEKSEMIRERGAAVGFKFGPRERIYNTFDAHRLLHWADLEGRQRELKHALFTAYFTDGDNPGDPEVLVRAAVAAGLDGARAREILATDTYAAEVRAQEQFYQARGIHAVPSIIINDRHLIQGGQPAEIFARALRQIAAAA